MNRTREQRLLTLKILKTIARAQKRGERIHLGDIVEATRGQREEVRALITWMHRNGYLDVVTMQLTMAGFAIGIAARGGLGPVRWTAHAA